MILVEFDVVVSRWQQKLLVQHACGKRQRSSSAFCAVSFTVARGKHASAEICLTIVRDFALAFPYLMDLELSAVTVGPIRVCFLFFVLGFSSGIILSGCRLSSSNRALVVIPKMAARVRRI